MTLFRLLALPAAGEASLWLPEQASTVAASVDEAWWLVYWVSAVFFAIIVVAQVYFMWAYRRRAGWTEQKTAHHNFPLELTWSIIPSLIIVVMFVKGFLGFLDMRMPPADTYDITVVARKWSWSFIYPNGVVHPELHVPVDRNVKLVMSSDDVIHSLFVPVFRVKQDIVPGRYNYLWFNATKPGTYDLECTEYCGTNHSEMRTKTVVHEPGGMERWLEDRIEDIMKMPPIELGTLLYNQRGCSQCHMVDGKGGTVGPKFEQTFGNRHQFTDGSQAVGDENYIRESVMNPQAQVRTGFPPTMPTYKGLFREAEIRGLIAFIKSQNPKFKAEAEREYAKPAGETEAGDASPDSDLPDGGANGAASADEN
ncbi:MAG: cytochrome c oxidase subunit II [Planctomycetota bacterium]|nr:cytochrome c oxidase subunit II [Planctomycetaceae bacterium]MDQ3330057.1 cytochrome c oxidase subunit II [Planctomycetota bacterium]